MKIAVGIIGMMIGLLVTLQSCTVAVGSHVLADQAGFEEGSAGLTVGVFAFIAGAFAFGLPGTATVLFVIAGLVGLLIGTQGTFTDLAGWGGACLLLALLAFSARSKKHSKPVKDKFDL